MIDIRPGENCWQALERLQAERDDLRAERDRLRHALNRIRHVSNRLGWYVDVDAIAREALEPTK